MRYRWMMVVLVTAACCGCVDKEMMTALKEESDPENKSTPAKMEAAVTETPPAEKKTPGSMVPGLAPITQTPAKSTMPAGAQLPQGTQPLALNPPANQPAVQQVPAQVGVAAQGRSLDNETGILVQPAKSLFAFKERAVFEIQIPQAMSLFQATEGRKPDSDDEFMSRIIKANKIALPRLPPGQSYRYDPQRGQLMVIRPKG